MEIYDLAIINGMIYLGGTFVNSNLYIYEGKVKTISTEVLEAKEVYDAEGNYVLPGFIDPHVHFFLRVGEKSASADDFYSGSITAAYGGVTTVIDFLDPVKNTEELEEAYDKRMIQAKGCLIDYGFHSCIANFEDDEEFFIKSIKNLGMCSIKFFTTYASSNRNTSLKTIEKLLKLSKKNRVMLVSHSENNELITEGSYPVSTHEDNRPSSAEITEVLTLAEMTRLYDGIMYLVHVSSGESLKRLKENYGDVINKQVFIETCPHYLYLSKENYSKEFGYLYTMAPPLRSREEMGLLKNYIDYVDTIGTDHCPFMVAEKKHTTLDNIPMGIGGIEHSFELMYTMFGEAIIDKFTSNPAKLEGIYPKKGNLFPGADADVVVFDPKPNRTIEVSHSRCDYDPYKGIDVKGRILATISKGNFIVKNGEFVGDTKARGNYLYRSLYNI